MLTSAVICSSALFCATTSDDLSRDQFVALMSGLMADIKDTTFVYEGRFVTHAAPADARKKSKKPPSFSFQGLYSFRSDGSVRLELFQFSLDDNRPFSHQIQALFKGKLQVLYEVPDLRSASAVTSTAGGPGSFNFPGSPSNIQYMWYFEDLCKTLKPESFEFQGWEAVDGERCLRVQITRAPSKDPAKRRPDRFWLDVNRGGHTRKVEFYLGPHLGARADNIEIRRFTAQDGKKVWFPVRGDFSTFMLRRGTYSDTPVSTATLRVVASSLRFNEGLPDWHFDTIKTRSRGGYLSAARRSFSAVAPAPLSRTDPVGVQKQLERELAEADLQAKRLEASSPARQAGAWYAALPTILLSGGALVLVLAGLVYVRARARQ